MAKVRTAHFMYTVKFITEKNSITSCGTIAESDVGCLETLLLENDTYALKIWLETKKYHKTSAIYWK